MIVSSVVSSNIKSNKIIFSAVYLDLSCSQYNENSSIYVFYDIIDVLIDRKSVEKRGITAILLNPFFLNGVAYVLHEK